MKIFKSILPIFAAVGFVILVAPPANAFPGDSISGGGQILQGEQHYKISFTFPETVYDSASQIVGELQIVFHNTSKDSINKATFVGTDITDMTFFAPDSNTCTAAMNMTVHGTLNGESGYTVIFRAGDGGTHGHWTDTTFDTARITLKHGSSTVYDTHDGDFENQSHCVGTARTGVDRGDLFIEHASGL